MIMGLVVAILVFLYFGLPRLLAVPSIRQTWDPVLLRIPIVGSFVSTGMVARVANSFGVLMTSGIPLLECFERVGAAAGSTVVVRAFNEISRDIQQGKDLGTTLGSTGIFPVLFVQMVKVGEKAGSLDKMFPRIATHYERQLERALSAFTSIIEPLSMVIVGGVVFMFVIGVLLPIMAASLAVNK